MEKPVKNIIHNWYMNPDTGRITGTYQDGNYIDTSPVVHFQYIPDYVFISCSHSWRAETRNSIYRLGLPLVLA